MKFTILNGINKIKIKINLANLKSKLIEIGNI